MYLNYAGMRFIVVGRRHDVSMQYHQSWHDIKRLVFGNWSDY